MAALLRWLRGEDAAQAYYDQSDAAATSADDNDEYIVPEPVGKDKLESSLSAIRSDLALFAVHPELPAARVCVMMKGSLGGAHHLLLDTRLVQQRLYASASRSTVNSHPGSPLSPQPPPFPSSSAIPTTQLPTDIIGDMVFGTAPLRSSANNDSPTKIHIVSETGEFCVSKVFSFSIRTAEQNSCLGVAHKDVVRAASEGSDVDAVQEGRDRSNSRDEVPTAPATAPKILVGVVALFPIHLLVRDHNATEVGVRPVGLRGVRGRISDSSHVHTHLQKFVLHFLLSHFIVIDTRLRKVVDITRHFLSLWFDSSAPEHQSVHERRAPIQKPPRLGFQDTPALAAALEFSAFVCTLFRTPRLMRPIWPHLLSFPEAQDTVLSHFFDELSKCFDIMDVGNSKPLTACITAILMHHNAWRLNLQPSDVDQATAPPAFPCSRASRRAGSFSSAAHKQLWELYGAGNVVRICVCGGSSAPRELIESTLTVLSYFVRSSQVFVVTDNDAALDNLLHPDPQPSNGFESSRMEQQTLPNDIISSSPVTSAEAHSVEARSKAAEGEPLARKLSDNTEHATASHSVKRSSSQVMGFGTPEDDDQDATLQVVDLGFDTHANAELTAYESHHEQLRVVRSSSLDFSNAASAVAALSDETGSKSEIAAALAEDPAEVFLLANWPDAPAVAAGLSHSLLANVYDVPDAMQATELSSENMYPRDFVLFGYPSSFNNDLMFKPFCDDLKFWLRHPVLRSEGPGVQEGIAIVAHLSQNRKKGVECIRITRSEENADVLELPSVSKVHAAPFLYETLKSICDLWRAGEHPIHLAALLEDRLRDAVTRASHWSSMIRTLNAEGEREAECDLNKIKSVAAQALGLSDGDIAFLEELARYSV